MYDVSQEYIDKLFSVGQKQRRIIGTIDGVEFTEADIKADSLTITDKCLNSDDIRLGGVFIGQLELTFLPSFGTKIARGTWKDREINISIGLNLGGDTWEDIPVKPFFVSEANHSKHGIALTCYDAMEFFDKRINFDTAAGTVYDFANLAGLSAGVELGQTQAQIRALPNGNINLGLYPENDCETLRDLISWLAATIGGYATINRDGKLVFKTWHSAPDLTIDIYNRDVNGKWGDFETYYTGLSVTNLIDQTSEYYHVTPDTGLTMNLGSNPFMQYGVKEVKAQMCAAILEALSGFVYTPFNSQSYIDIALDLGDVIEYTDGLAGDSSICCVHKFVFSYSKGVKVTGYGKNPALFGAQSKTDKNISGLLSQQQANEIITHTFVNASEINVTSTLSPLLNIRFATVSAKFVKFLAEVELITEANTAGGTVTATVYYYVNNELQEYSPVTSWNNNGAHLLHLLYWLQNLAAGQSHKIEAYIKVTGGTATININGVHALLEGQGLVTGDGFDGYIEVDDIYNLVQHASGVFNYSDNVSSELRAVEFVEFDDVYTLNQHASGVFNYSDSVDLITQKTEYDIISADGEYQITSADDDYYLGTAE